ncbi:MAG TPA: glutathione S-transferase family protein [Solirubrobacteraceae bacterium]|nr:glutathione S-transferase family protein [Solirubrobacteraceae bacterium]
MRLHDYAASGNCYKARLLLALLGLPYERVAVDIFAGDTLTDAFGALNPLRETPVLELDDGTVLTQSPAILTYLAEETPFMPTSRLGRAQVAQWLAFEQERVMGAIGGTRFRLMTGRATAEQLAGRLALARDTLDVLAGRLAARPFLLGNEPTIADVAAFAYASRAGDIGLPPASWPAFDAWLERMRALPGFFDDFVPYPANARPGASRSIYDS